LRFANSFTYYHQYPLLFFLILKARQKDRATAQKYMEYLEQVAKAKL